MNFVQFKTLHFLRLYSGNVFQGMQTSCRILRALNAESVMISSPRHSKLAVCAAGL